MARRRETKEPKTLPLTDSAATTTPESVAAQVAERKPEVHETKPLLVQSGPASSAIPGTVQGTLADGVEATASAPTRTDPTPPLTAPGVEPPSATIPKKWPQVLVLGDVNIDTLVATLPSSPEAASEELMTWEVEAGCSRFRRLGGAWLLTEIIQAALDFGDGRKSDVYSFDEPRDWDRLSAPYLSSAAVLKLYPQTPKEKATKQDLVYRIERLMGWIQDRWDPRAETLKKTMADALKSLEIRSGEGPIILALHRPFALGLGRFREIKANQ